MATKVPEKLRDASIVQCAHRAAQLEKVKPIISYWLRFYITQKVIDKGLHLADDECKLYTANLLQTLEETKAAHPNEDALLDEIAAHAYCEQFALETFARADNVVKANKVTVQTADTFRAAAVFLDLLSIWRNPPEPEIAAKSKYAKYHALRITKALKAGENPNLSNPILEPPPEPQAEDEPEQPPQWQPPSQRPYQPYAESAPDTSAQPSPPFSAARVSPPPNIPSAPSGYPSGPISHFPSHRDVSPISPPSTSRKGSADSTGGGYFPRVDVPTFTAEQAPALSTASVDGEPIRGLSPDFDDANPFVPTPSDPQSFYQKQQLSNPVSPPHNPFPSQPPPPQSAPPPQQFSPNPYPPQQPHYSAPQPQHSQPAQSFPASGPSSQQQYHHPPQPPPEPMTGVVSNQQGPFKTDEEAIMSAQKHAKWAISALNFEDVPTAVKELRIALQSLGAR